MQKSPHVTSYLTEHFADDAYGTLAGYRARGGFAAVLTKPVVPAALFNVVARTVRAGRGAEPA